MYKRQPPYPTPPPILLLALLALLLSQLRCLAKDWPPSREGDGRRILPICCRGWGYRRRSQRVPKALPEPVVYFPNTRGGGDCPLPLPRYRPSCVRMPFRVHDVFERSKSLTHNAILLPTTRDRPLETVRQLCLKGGVWCYAAMRRLDWQDQASAMRTAKMRGLGEPVRMMLLAWSSQSNRAHSSVTRDPS